MTVEQLSKLENFKPIFLAEGDRQISGVYCGDLLSWVMGKATSDDAWITIMNNVNILAVASLVDASCIILSENVLLDDEVLNLAKSKQLNVLSTSLTTYEAAVILSKNI